MRGQRGKSMWGYSIPFWEAVFRWSTIAAFVLGGLGVTAAFISTWVGAKLGDISQNEFNLKLAEANAQALQAQLALEKYKAPRRFSPDQQKFIADAVKPFSGQEFQGLVASSVADGHSFWETVHKTLLTAGWVFIPPSSMGFGNPPAGVPIVSDPGISIFAPNRNEAVGMAAMVLAKAIMDQGFDVRLVEGALGDNASKPKMIAIEIGPKP